MHFNLKRFKNLSIESIDIEEMTGQDSMDAAARAIGPGGGPPKSAIALDMEHRNQLIASAISKVDGEMVVRPYLAWQRWNLRTQEFVITAYNRMNDVTKKELDSFIAAHFGAEDEVRAPESSESGSGSHGMSEDYPSAHQIGSDTQTSIDQ